MKYELLTLIVVATCGCISAAPTMAPSANASSRQPKAPKHSYESLVRIGQTYCDSGEAVKALSPLNQAIAQEPTRPQAYIVLGFSLAAQSKLTESTTAYEKARSLGSRERRLFQELSSVYDVQKKYNKAIEIYRHWLSISPNDTEMRHELSLSLVLTEQFPEAITLLKEVIAQTPNPKQPRGDLAYAYARSGQHAKATVILRELYPHGLPYSLLFEFLQTHDRPTAALDFFEQFAVTPLDKNHQKLRAHLISLTKN